MFGDLLNVAYSGGDIVLMNNGRFARIVLVPSHMNGCDYEINYLPYSSSYSVCKKDINRLATLEEYDSVLSSNT